MKKILALLLAGALGVTMLAACTPAADDSADGATTDDGATGAMTGEISVVSREEGSGTRGAFVEIVGVVDEEGNDITTLEAIVGKSTNEVMTQVVNNPAAIGYISLGSLNDTVTALSVDGVEPTVENIKSGEYTVARPFNIATNGEVDALTQDFINFIMSADGQAIVSEEGYIAVSENEAYAGTGGEGTIKISGSTSVGPVMEKMADAYKAINTGVQIDIQQSGSSSGMNDAMEGIVNIGMASRELKDSELEVLTPIVIAQDGIAVITNNENSTTNIALDTVKEIYLGNLVEWADVK